MRLFGLVGYPLTHSFSKTFFTQKFSSMGMGEELFYENFSIPDIEELPYLLIQKKYLDGFNITIPYKKQVIPFLHQLTPEVAEMGACNCVRIQNKKINWIQYRRGWI